MKIIHTSDWHLGQNFMSRDRKEEHRKFLNWLVEQIKAHQPHCLIVAGDVFDTGTPPNYAEELYFKFLADVSALGFCHMVITGGNHDSVSTLHAPKKVLRAIQTHVIGCRSENPKDDIIVIKDASGNPSGIVCGVPFLRERDIRGSFAGESYEEKGKAIAQGIKEHYTRIQQAAEKKCRELRKNLPMVATGHLYAAGGILSDGVRDIHVGGLGQVGTGTLQNSFDYVALGHLHRPQKVDGKDHVRYCGSPIPLSFSEAKNEKEVLLVDFKGDGTPHIQPIPVPEFRRLRVIKGDLDAITRGIDKLPEDKETWLEVQYDGKAWQGNLENRVLDSIAGKPVELFAVRNTGRSRHRKPCDKPFEHLKDLEASEVFKRRLAAAKVPEEMMEEMTLAFSEIMDRLGLPEEEKTR